MKTRLRNCDSEASAIKRAPHWLARVLAALSATNEAILSSSNVEEMLQKVIAAAVGGEGFLGAPEADRRGPHVTGPLSGTLPPNGR